jgi:hypothetical protein
VLGRGARWLERCHLGDQDGLPAARGSRCLCSLQWLETVVACKDAQIHITIMHVLATLSYSW